MRVKRLRPGARLPERATEGATGYDLYACLDAPIVVGHEPVQVPTGIAIEIGAGFDVQIRPRSGLSSRGVVVTFGTIDSDYRGELLVTMHSLHYREPHEVNDGDRIAQLVIGQALVMDMTVAEDLSETARGAGGHGSTGR
ncbi:MAG: dUTP diphosphatase [Chloroflexi bacterium]|nr:dUTP diphosphatase [Chloroflexota bacterium]MCH7953253.1 dUTP diphosphatase [Chloroflexota bacterium]MCI0783201.1 dUTP diphosphatase [Chloroflexota bacterium]MCI0831978.1 dUTP diphosphatase [Chloroflexota bacterium]MCI0882915.1 dUTP diphosphatase [Chloroflexota bacterium]